MDEDITEIKDKIVKQQYYISSLISSIMMDNPDNSAHQQLVIEANNNCSDNISTLCKKHIRIRDKYHKLQKLQESSLTGTDKETASTLLIKYSSLLLKWLECEMHLVKLSHHTPADISSPLPMSDNDVTLACDYLQRTVHGSTYASEFNNNLMADDVS